LLVLKVSFTIHHNIVFMKKVQIFVKTCIIQYEIYQKLSEIDQCETNNQHVLNALRSVIGRYNM